MVGGGSALGVRQGFEASGEGEDLAGERHDADFLEGGVHADDRRLPHGGVCYRPLVGCRRPVMDLGDFGAVAGLFDQLLLRQQVVGESAVQFPDLVEQFQFSRGVVAQVADQFADPGPVFLLDVGAVVLVAGAGAGESDVLLIAVAFELFVDEFAAVIRIDSDDREGEDTGDVHQGLEYPFLGLVLHGAVHCPPGGDVGAGESKAELAATVPAFVPYEVDLHEPGDRVIPLGPGADWD